MPQTVQDAPVGIQDTVLTILPPPLFLLDRCAETSAAKRAGANWAANRRALGKTQGDLADRLVMASAQLDWTFGRDGFLSGKADGTWWTKCSVPLAAGKKILKSLDLTGAVSCYLDCTHAGQLRAAFDLARADQSIVAAVLDERTARVILSCEDFSREISTHRLWFAVGENWSRELCTIFQKNPGLPLPAQFIRTLLSAEDAIARMVETAQRAIADETARRAELVSAVLSRGQGASRDRIDRVCVVSPGMFRLWDFAGIALATAVCGAGAENGKTWERFDSDDPVHASPVALAIAAQESDAILAADAGRGDLPGVAATAKPWITWVTTPRAPRYDESAPGDAVILADAAWRKLAAEAGWPADRVAVAGWPGLGITGSAKLAIAGESATTNAFADRPPFLAMAIDTRPVEMPPAMKAFSSHVLLWEMIEEELARDPLALDENISRYLSQRMGKFKIAEEGFDRAAFTERLLIPAYQQGLARVLIRAELPIALFGKGWNALTEFKDRFGGTVDSLDDLRAIAGASAGMIHAWPQLHAHAIDALGAAVIRRPGRRAESLVREAKALLAAAQGVALAPNQNSKTPAALPRGADATRPAAAASISREVVRGLLSRSMAKAA